MKTFDKIFLLIWNLSTLLFGGLFLSSDLGGLNNWAAWFIAGMLWLIASADDLKNAILDNKIEELEKLIKTKQDD